PTEFFIMLVSRRPVTYRYSLASGALVLAPQIRMPSPGKYRMQFTPAGFRTSCSPRPTRRTRAIAPWMGSLAGALWTPRVASTRAHTPAIWPDGGCVTFFPDTGSIITIHGKYSAV